MNTTTSRELTVEPRVYEFLKRRHAEEEFETTAEVVRECLPELQGVEVGLWEDPDLEDRWRVMFHVTLPASHPLDLLQDQRRRLAERLVERMPPVRFPDPVCALTIGFARG